MTRNEHLAWTKQRALEYWAINDYSNAVISMMSDLKKHDELAHHSGVTLGMMLLGANKLESNKEVHDWIVGFN